MLLNRDLGMKIPMDKFLLLIVSLVEASVLLNLGPTAAAKNASAPSGIAISGRAAIDIISKLISDPDPLVSALNKLSDNVKDSIPETFIDEKSLEKIADDSNKLDHIFPTSLEPIDNPAAIRRFALGGKDKGTLIGSTKELERLQVESSKRSEEITKLTGERNSLAELAGTYKASVEKAQVLSEKIGKLASDPLVEFMGRIGGKSVALSWAQFETEVVPALAERQAAAERGVSRFDAQIASATKDLKGFDEARLFSAAIFSGNPNFGNGANYGLGSFPSIADVDIKALSQEMGTNTQAALKVANELQKEANNIRRDNAQLAKYRQFLGILGAGLNLAQQAGDGSTGATKTPTMIFNKIENKWYININGSQKSVEPGLRIGPKT
jgi:hypothetical protein